MALTKDQKQLQTLCGRGIFAEWNTESGELLSVTQLDFESGKSMLATIDTAKIVAYLTTKRQFRVFNLETK